MSTSPLPPDPYEALGLDRDCDVDAVKKAHRKLVLKHHPDRIKDPALVEHNQNEFTKVQQAYEILVDPVRRRRYDDECRLAQLRRERMSESRPTYTRTTYSAPRPTPPTNPIPRDIPREFKQESRYAYEERAPDSPYVESMPRGFDDPLPRGNPRKVDLKVDPSEKRPSTSKPSGSKEKPRGWERDTHNQKPISIKTVFGMASMASTMAQAQKAKSKEREKEMHAKNAKTRDKEERSARDIKNTYSKPPPPSVEEELSDSDDESSGSESDTVVTNGRSRMRGLSPPARTRHLTPEPPRAKRQPSPMSEVRASRQQSPRPVQRPARRLSPGTGPKPTRQPSPRPEARPMRQPSPRPEARPYRQPSPRPDPRDHRSAYDDDSGDDDKHTHFYRSAQDYITTAQRKDPRPPVARQGSGVHDQYWHTDSGRDRKSGSDSDKQRPSSSSQKPSRRSMPEDAKLRPSLFPQSSAPAGVRSMAGVESRDPSGSPRSRGNSYVTSSNHRREMPELKRSPSEPVPQKAQAKRDSVPLKGSSLKQTESMPPNHDSGYGSSPNPQTPETRETRETRGESPHRESRPREASSTTKYSVRKDEDAPRARRMGGEDGAPMSRFLSPEDRPHHHHHHHNPESRERHASRSREREHEGRHRSSSNRPAHPERQSSYRSEAAGARYDERDRSRNIRNERSPDRHNRSGGAEDGYFRQWPGPVRESRPKQAMYQGPPTPSFTKQYGEPSPRSVPHHRKTSLYA